MMEKKVLKFVNKSPNPNPSYAKAEDSGFDIRAWIKYADEGAYEQKDGSFAIMLMPGERTIVHTGLYFQLPSNTEIQVRTRSGCAYKLGLIVANSPGTIDRPYNGECCVIAINLSKEAIKITSGDRIAQGILMPVFNEPLVQLENVDEITEETDRGSDGFGSTGMK